jgi:glutamate-1-semialdehyde 2,1-aminomutase
MKKELQRSLDSLVAEYAANNPRSGAMCERAKHSLPGSNSRTGLYFHPFPPYIDRGEGVHLIDLDGHYLLDFVNQATALILGHAHPEVVDALQEQLAKGTAFSRPTELEVEMAELLKERIPSLEHVRFCSSGTEAVMNAIRSAKGFTGKPKIAKFEGAYHGTSEFAMVSYCPPLNDALGPAERPNSVLSSAGIAEPTGEGVIVLPFNDAESCEQIINAHTDELAAVIVDPLSTGAGFTLPKDGFLSKLRELTRRENILLIFDEIISFRAARGGAQETYNIHPDLTCLAKVIAGGVPGAAFGGRADILAQYDPTTKGEKIHHGGTFNANPLAMVAGLTTLRIMTPEAYDKIAGLTRRLAKELKTVFDEVGVEAQISTAGSLFKVHFMSRAPSNYREAAQDDGLMHNWLFFALLNQGIDWREGGNVSLPMDDSHVDRLMSAVTNAFHQLY